MFMSAIDLAAEVKDEITKVDKNWSIIISSSIT